MASDGRGDDQSPVGGGKAPAKTPPIAAKKGVKGSLLSEGRGVPLAVAVGGANRHDMKLTERTLEGIMIERPEPTEKGPQPLCQDAGYDSPEVREIVAKWGYTAHIRSRGEEKEAKERVPGYRARRWVVERTHSWLNRLRRLLIRWEKKVDNYLAMLHFACAWITCRAAGVFG